MKDVINQTGFFKEQYHKFRKSFTDKDLKCFAGLKTDVERWKFVKERNRLEFPSKSKYSKNLEEALSLKEKGNKCFQGNQNANALSFYSQSLVMYPPDGDRIEFSIIRANRSAALYHLQEYQAALTDIEMALAQGYPKHLHHKVLDRKAKCLMALKQNYTAIQALRETISALDDAKIPADVRQKKQNDIQIMMGIMVKSKAFDEKNKTRDDINKIAGEKNPKYKAASKAIGFGLSENEGRFALAESNVQTGDVILREPPHCAVLLQENTKTHCFQCMKRCYFIEPCPNCSAVIFCSPKCQQLASKTHHKYECEVLRTLWESGASITCLLALRIIIQKPFAYFLKVVGELEIIGKVGSSAEYNGADYSTVFNLVRHEERRSTEDMIHRTYMALFLHDCLKKSGYFNGNNELSGEDHLKAEVDVGGLILRHLQSLQFNAHEISEMIFNSSDPKTWKSIFVGAGLFPTLALFNHSCEPSIVRYFEGSKVVVRAIKNIKKGEKIFENYGPIFTQTPKAERQSTLRNQYWFDCSCEPCTRNWPMLNQMDVSSMRFPCDDVTCDNVIIVPVNTGSFMMQCNKCGRLTNIMKGLKVLQDSESLFLLGESFLQAGEILKALRKFLELQTLLSNTLVPPFRDFYLCQQNVRNCIVALGNTHPPLDKFVKRQNVNDK
uniref:Protein-lysine N-methyltransferase SMYD4 n=1 Tax=Lygus hesperus TaxID=30085 RepID=A0A146LER3_LYGHE